MSPTVTTLQFLSVYHYPPSKNTTATPTKWEIYNPYSWMTMANLLCNVQFHHLLDTVQIETMENKTKAKNRRNKTKNVTGYELNKWVWLLAKIGIYQHEFHTSSAANHPAIQCVSEDQIPHVIKGAKGAGVVYTVLWLQAGWYRVQILVGARYFFLQNVLTVFEAHQASYWMVNGVLSQTSATGGRS